VADDGEIRRPAAGRSRREDGFGIRCWRWTRAARNF